MNYFDPIVVNDNYPGAYMIPPEKIWTLPKNKKNMLKEVCSNGEYFAQLKKDGYFYSLNTTKEKDYLFSRTTSVTGLLSEKSANVPHIIEAFSKVPKNTVFIGEIYYPNCESKDVTSIMGCLPEKAVERQKERGLIHYYVHDIIFYNGVNLMETPCLKRYELLEKIFEKYSLANDFIELAKVEFEDLFDKVAQALADGEEGMVLKKKTSLYYPDKRPAWDTIKVKQVDHVDVVIMDLVDATKEYTGKDIKTWDYWIIEKKNALEEYSFYEKCPIGKPIQIKGIDFRTIPVNKYYYNGTKNGFVIGGYKDGVLTRIGTVASGLTDQIRADMTQNPSKYIGKTVEIQCMSIDKESCSIRHPFVTRVRDDKSPESCTFAEIFDF